MKLKDIIFTANSNLLRNKVRTVLTILAIFIGAFTISLSVGINIGVNRYADKFLDSMGSKTAVTITKGVATSKPEGDGKYNPDAKQEDLETMSEKDLENVRGNKYIKNAYFREGISTEYIIAKNGDKMTLGLVQADPGFRPEMRSGKPVESDSKDAQVMLAPEFVKRLGYESADELVGKNVTIGAKSAATGKVEEVTATVSGVRAKSPMISSNSMANKAFADTIIAVNQKGVPEAMRGKPYVIVAETKGELTDAQVTEMKAGIKSNVPLFISTFKDTANETKDLIDGATAVLLIFGGIALLAAIFGIINTLYMGVQERTREIGLMKAMGMSRRRIFSLFSAEAMMIGFWGSLIGVIAAMGAGAVANPLITKMVLSQAGTEGFKLIGFNVPSVLGIIVVLMLIAFVAGVLPSRKASKQNPIDALRYE